MQFFVATAALGALSLPAYAQDIEIGGILINETRTFSGQEFYNAFSGIWQAYDPDSKYTLVITERPSARSGSQLTVTFAGVVVFQRFIGFSARMARQYGEAAASAAYQSVQTAELDRMLGGDPDLAAGDIE